MNLAYILLAYGALFALSLLDNGRGPSYPQILSDFAMGTDKGAYIFSLASIASLFVNITSRYWLKWFGPVVSTKASLLVMGISGFIISIAGKMTNYPLLLVGALIYGLGQAVCTMTMNILVAKGSTNELRRKLFCGLHAVYGIASFLAPMILSGIMWANGTWKTFFLCLGVFNILVFIAALSIKKMGTVEKADKAELIAPLSFSKRIPFGLLFGFYVSAEVMISSRLALFLQRTHDMGQVESGNYLSLFFFFLLSGRLLFAFKSFRVKGINLMKFSLASSLVIFLAGYFFHPGFYSALGLSMSYFFPVAMDWFSLRFEEGLEVMTASIMTYIGVMIAAMHWIFGVIASKYEVSTAFWLVPTFLIIALILVMTKDDDEMTFKNCIL